MASNWIKVEVITPDKPEIFLISEKLNIDPDMVLGKLIRLWVWADQQIAICNDDSVTDIEHEERKGNASVLSKIAIDRIAFMPGFADALIFVGWLVQDGDSLYFNNFEKHNGKSSKNRSLTNDRVNKARNLKRKRNENGNASSVTGSDQKAVPKEEEEEEEEKDKKHENILPDANENQHQASEVVFISLPLSDGKSFFDVTEGYFLEQVALYPGVNIEQEFRNMLGWLNSNPAKRKTPRGIKRFITTWLQNSQDKPRGWQSDRPAPRDVNQISQPNNTIPPGFRG